MSKLIRPCRRAALTTLFLVSEGFLLTFRLVAELWLLGTIWRMLLIPAYIVILLASLVVPWKATLVSALVSTPTSWPGEGT